MECNGICYDDKAAYFKVTCPGTYNNVPHKLIIYKNGSVNKEYKEVCDEPHHHATIAYNNEPNWFEVDKDGNIKGYDKLPRIGLFSIISPEYDILTSFFENYKIKPSWINCNYTWGLFDEETGHWTGAVGKVILYSMFIINIKVQKVKLGLTD